MNTEEFLAHILPDVGLRVVVSISKRGTFQKFFTDNASAAAYIAKTDKPGTDVYFGCATYASHSRKAADVEAVKAFWLDIDCGEGKPYATREEAQTALDTFCADQNLAPPTVVQSGVGLHVYWTLDTPITPDEWLPTAHALKAAAARCGLEAGPERTADIASILRPVGSTHRKSGARPVRLARLGACVAVAAFSNALNVGESGRLPDGAIPGAALSAQIRDILGVPTDSSDLIAGLHRGPAPAAESVANICAVIKEFSEDGGAHMPEPLWRACLGVIHVCEDGEEKAHEWSAKDPRYLPAETQAKLDRLQGTGATLCATIEQYRPEACQACPLYQQCKSPISQAYRVAAPVPVTTPAPGFVTSAPIAPTVAIPPLPYPFKWGSINNRQGIYMTMPDKADPTGQTLIDVFVSSVLFYAIAPITTSDGKRQLRWRMHRTPTSVQEFTLPNTIVGDTRAAGKLAEYDITWETSMSKHLQKYISAWIDHHRTTPGIKSHNAYGWTDDWDFIVGERKYVPGGVEAATLTGTAQSRAKHLTMSGDLATWADLVDRAYNNDQSYAWQFALLTSMGAPLLQLLGGVKGLTVYMHSEESGYGKSTAEQVALSVWGSSDGLSFANQRVTVNAFAASLGAMRNLPGVLDELTAMENKAACELVHLVSSGAPKERCASTGEILTREQHWCTFLLASGNVLLGEKMAMHRAHAEAEVARLFEYTVPNIPKEERLLQPQEAYDLFHQFTEQYGTAGDALIRYIVDNREDVQARLRATHKKVLARFKFTQTERFWAALVTCVLSALDIGRKLGIVNFPVSPLVMWIQAALISNRQGMTEAVTDYNDAFSRMLGDYHGQMLVTEGKGSIYMGKEAYVYRHPTQGKALVGRVIIRTPGPVGGTDPEVVYLTVKAAKEWCSQRNVSYREVLKQATTLGLVRGSPTRFQLGSGCPSYLPLTAPVECLVIDLAKVQGVLVPDLTVLVGGRATQ